MSKKPIVIDLFCGAGGESTGIHKAMGEDIKLFAVNHWEVACATHALNYPSDECICQDIQTVIPTSLVKPNEQVELLWASPECVHFSTARGGMPMDDQSRCTPFDILRWLTMLNVKRVIIENVKEFETWGPLTAELRPDKKQAGSFFQMFINALRNLNYTVDWRVCNAADFGAHTSRRRLFIQCVKKGSGKSIVWPEQLFFENTEADMFAEVKQPWRPVKEVINWDIPQSPISNRKKPLKDSTMNKIFDGILKFWGGEICEPFLARFNSGKDRVHSINKPCPVLDCSPRYALVEPLLMGYYGNATFTPVTKPCPTLTCMDRFGLIEPILEKHKVVDISLRMLTVEEMQLIQSFPKEYKFTGNHQEQVRQIGNAVCPVMAEALVNG